MSKFSSRPQSDDAGDHATGCSVPLAILDSASPDDTLLSSTNTGCPPTFSRRSLKRWIRGFSSFSFSGE
ncbi:MAG: hypothetical protein ACJ760_04680 [Thermoleophilaceae bacterium]